MKTANWPGMTFAVCLCFAAYKLKSKNLDTAD